MFCSLQHDILPSEIAACRGYEEVGTLIATYGSETPNSSEVSPNPIFELMSHRRPPPAITSPSSPLSSLTLSPTALMGHLTPSVPAYSSSSVYTEPPPSYEEVMNSDSLFGCTAYSQSAEDSDTTALLGAD